MTALSRNVLLARAGTRSACAPGTGFHANDGVREKLVCARLVGAEQEPVQPCGRGGAGVVAACAVPTRRATREKGCEACDAHLSLVFGIR